MKGEALTPCSPWMEMMGCSRRVHSGGSGAAGLEVGVALGFGVGGTAEGEKRGEALWDSAEGRGRRKKRRKRWREEMKRIDAGREVTSRGNAVMVTEANLSSSCQGGPLGYACNRRIEGDAGRERGEGRGGIKRKKQIKG